MRTGRLLEDIKSKTDIVDVISGYVQLKKSGQNWKGLCPFHPEKTPSFMVSQSKQMFRCFGCGAGGDVISFVSKYENLAFNEAVNVLAKKAGISLAADSADRKVFQKEEKIRAALRDASSFFVKKLAESGVARDYLEKRGINRESLDLFRVGYAPPGWHNLLRHMRSAGYGDSVIKEAGLAVAGEKGVYDMFRHRIIFPIAGMSGTVIAFGGRALDDAMPKYINSPETAVFNKSETLFGLQTAREEIRRLNSVIIVEGYMDVIICHQHGFRNAVAPLGTSLTSGHIQKLRSLTNKAALVFDGDAAGKAAAKRALPLICRNNYQARVVVLPDNEDPDSYLKKHGARSLSSLMERAQTVIDFLLDVSPKGEGVNIVREALALIAVSPDLLIADEMLRELSERTRISEVTIREEFSRIKSRDARSKPAQRERAHRQGNSEEYLLLSAVITFPEKAGYVLSRLGKDDLKDKTVVSLLGKIAALGGGRDIAGLLDGADDEERRLITKFSVDPGFDPEHVEQSIEGCLTRIVEVKRDEKKKGILEQIRLAERSGDCMQVDVLQKKFRQLEQG